MANGRRAPKSPEHRAKISAALKRRAQEREWHLRRFQRAGPEHPNWKGGVQPTYYRRVAKEVHGDVCQECGSDRHINVHHRDEDRSNSEPGNLRVLCRSCHNRAHKLGGRGGKHV